jgi:hypothetical protein
MNSGFARGNIVLLKVFNAFDMSQFSKIAHHGIFFGIFGTPGTNACSGGRIGTITKKNNEQTSRPNVLTKFITDFCRPAGNYLNDFLREKARLWREYNQ